MSNVAVTAVAAVTFTAQVLVPLHAPDQPVNVDPALGVAVRVTVVPLLKVAVHVVVGQLIPAGVLLTVPVPVPPNVTATGNVETAAVSKVAVTEAVAEAIMLQVPVPEQAPDQPVNVEPVAGVAVKVIAVPAAKLALHVDPQLMPAGALVTVPDPVPAATTLI